MKRIHFMIGLLCVAVLAFADYDNIHFGKYRTVYDGRINQAANDAEVIYLTMRYDETLQDIQQRMEKGGITAQAEAARKERERIRKLPIVINAKVFGDPLSAAKPGQATVLKHTVEYFGVKQECSRPVFLLMAGPSITQKAVPGSPNAGRLTYHIMQSRLLDTIDQLPPETQFNAAVFWMANTTPFSPELLSASDENKEQYLEWSLPINALNVDDDYSDFIRDSGPKISRLAWPEKLSGNTESGAPKWVYDYKPSTSVAAHYSGNYPELKHWAKALCFAFEQKADAVFIVTPTYTLGGDAPGKLASNLEKMAKEVYGKDAEKLPTVHVILVESAKDFSLRLDSEKDSFNALAETFNGEIKLIEDIEDWMTKDEKELFE